MAATADNRGVNDFCSLNTQRQTANMPPQRSRHQEKIIKNYYQNRDTIGLQKAQEAVTELYLSEGKKRATIWKRLVSHLQKIGLPADQIANLQQQDDPEQVAKVLSKFV